MKRQKIPSALIYIFISSFPMILACATPPILRMPKNLPPIVKEYKHVTIPRMDIALNTGVYLEKGELFSMLFDAFYKSRYLSARVGDRKDRGYIPPGENFTDSPRTGYLYFESYAVPSYGDPSSIGVDIIVWQRKNYDQIVQFFKKMKKEDPNNEAIINALTHAKMYKGLYLAEAKASKEIQETKKKIQELKEEPQKMVTGPDSDQKYVAQAKPSALNLAKHKKIAELEAKLIKLTETLAQLEEIKRQLKQEKTRATLLSQKLTEITREKVTLKTRLDSEADIRRQLSAKLEKAMIEKAGLKTKLESEADLKRRLESSLRERESALKRQEEIVASLYEKERQQRSKVFQLEQAQRESEENRKKLEEIKNRTEVINRELRQSTDEAKANVREKLDKILKAKLELETEAKNLKAKELRLRNEVSIFKVRSEEARRAAEKAKKELATARKREIQLASQVDDLRNRLNRGIAPVLVISKPINGSAIESPTTMLHIIGVDDRGIQKVDISLNGNPVKVHPIRGLEIVPANKSAISKKIDLTKRLQLAYGRNTISVLVTDTDGMSVKETVSVVREKERGKIWAVVIGINQYQNTRDLKYAVNDAEAFKKYLKEYIGMPDENIFLLTDQKATKDNIESLLGTHIKRKASKDDSVIIFYAGHGAVETDPGNPDGDGFEKYLLPYNADLNDLYSSSISMDDVKKIFQRIQSERLIFIADTCYSGASGGRTMLAYKTRATLSEKFFERISKGKGRVIISACSANEISKEDDSLKHGIFSFYLLEGLKGKADFDGDEIITVSELFSFLSRKVPEASGQDQHPVRKGETEGELVIGRVK